MKRLLLMLVLCATAWADSPKTLTSSIPFTDPSNNILANGTIVFTLNQGANVIGGGQVAQGLTVPVTLTAGGLIPGGTTIWANDQLQPTGTVYIVTIYNSNGLKVRGPENWIISGASPIDLSLETNVNLPDPGLGQPVLQNPATTQTITGQGLTLTATAPLTSAGNDSFSGTNTFTGTNTFAGTVNCKNVENVRCVDPLNSQGWSGATADVWITNAIAAASVSGPGTVWVFPGSYSLSATINFNLLYPTQMKSVELYACTLTMTSTNIDGMNMRGGNTLVGFRIVGTYDTTSPHIARAVNTGQFLWPGGSQTALTGFPYSPTYNNANGHLYTLTNGTNCTTGGSEPAWPLTAGATVSDGGCIWKEFGTSVGVVQSNYFSGWGVINSTGGGGAAINLASGIYGWQILNNDIDSNGGEGILIGSGAQHNTITNNIIKNNGFNAIDVNGGFNQLGGNQLMNTGLGRSCTGSDSNGVVITGVNGNVANFNTVTGNLMNGNGMFGVQIIDSGSGGQVNNNVVTGNTASGNSTVCTNGGGFEITEVGTASQIQNNRISNNVAINCVGSGCFGVICLLNGGTGTYSNNTCEPNSVAGNITNYQSSGVSHGYYGIQGQQEVDIWNAAQNAYHRIFTNGNQEVGISPVGGFTSIFDGTFPNEQFPGPILSVGTTFTVSSGSGACSSTGSLTGGSSAGSFQCTGTTGASALQMNPNTTGSAAHGYVCIFWDITTPANILHESSSGTTSCSFAGTVNANDTIYWAVIYGF